MKILLHTNAPWAGTGYGQQGYQLARHLRDAGHEVAFSAFYGLNGAMIEWDGFTLYPGGRAPYGADVIADHAFHFFEGDPQGGIVLPLVDTWVLPAQELADYTVLPWTPVDHEPLPIRIVDFFDRSGARPVAMARYGEKLLERYDPYYAPHGIDLEVFRPPEDKQRLRDLLGIGPDEFLVVQVGRNNGKPSRKAFPEVAAAFALFWQGHKDAKMYAVTEPLGLDDGINIPILWRVHGLHLGKQVEFSDPYEQRIGVPPEQLAAVYGAADVVVNPSWGEGFGIPIVEAQACGTRVITRDATAMPELTGPTSIAVGGGRTWTYQDAYQFPPDVMQILRALEVMYESRSSEPDMRSVEFAQRFEQTKVFDECWRPILADVEARLERKPDVEVVS